MFYNTIELSGEELQKAKIDCKSQEDYIKWIFTKKPTLEITPSELLLYFENNVPITSIRRALTNLTNDNILEKTSNYRMGNYGKPEHIWKLKKIKSDSVSQINLF